MSPPEQWSIGDRVLNPKRPDWGAGTVTSVAPHVAQGKRGQRLGVRFDGAGLKTVSTVIVELTKPRENPGDTPVADLTALPEALLDRSAPVAARLAEAASWYRFREGYRAALDWAIQRLGIRDPLSHLNREEIHAAREGFYRRLDHHTRELARELSRRDPEALKAVVATAPPAARPFLNADTGR